MLNTPPQWLIEAVMGSYVISIWYTTSTTDRFLLKYDKPVILITPNPSPQVVMLVSEVGWRPFVREIRDQMKEIKDYRQTSTHERRWSDVTNSSKRRSSSSEISPHYPDSPETSEAFSMTCQCISIGLCAILDVMCGLSGMWYSGEKVIV